MKVKSESDVAQSCPTLSDPMDCSLLGSSIHGIFQARVLEWMEQQSGYKLGKEYVKAVYCHPAYLTHMQSTSCKMPGWMKHKLAVFPFAWLSNKTIVFYFTQNSEI